MLMFLGEAACGQPVTEPATAQDTYTAPLDSNERSTSVSRNSRHYGAYHLKRLAMMACLAALPAGVAFGDAPLHERIDQAIEAAHFGPLAPPAADAEFLRRVTLDLTGIIPTSAEARAFLADQSPQKRAALIEKLLGSPPYARHLAQTFDAMLMERRPENRIKSAEWLEYLRQSFAENKPYDQLAREILSADGADPAHRAAARFYLDRDAETNLLTRDVGRLFFGRDMQCAQCHNHPLVDDYYQADYYGLYAFLNRGFIFVDAKKETQFAEKAEGEIGFKSVFTGYAVERVVPHLPKDGPIVEPTFAKGQEYVVPPAKDVRGIPKYSRRAQLAALATNGRNEAFNRNIVNRLWAQMFGRGLVHPLDLHHPDNPPSHPALLSLLADEFVAMKYDVKKFLGELALSRAYQRSSDAPSPAALPAGVAARRLPALEAEQAKCAALATASTAAADKSEADLATARATADKASAELTKYEAALAELKKANEQASADLAAAQKDLTAKQEAAPVLQEAVAKAQAALQKLPGDQVLVQAVKQIEASHAALAGEVTSAAQLLAQRTAQWQQAAARLAAQAERSPQGTLEVARQQASVLEQLVPVANRKAALDKAAADEAARQLAEAKAVVEYERLAALAATSKTPADAEARDQAWAGLADKWNKRFVWAALKPLSPEQLSWSLMQAAGTVETQRSAAEAELKKNATFTAQTPAQQAAALERATYDKMSPTAGSFVGLFAPAAGSSGQDFQPTVSQALFIENAEPMQNLVRPGPGNLEERLSKMTDVAALADEMYLSVLSRYPDATEKADVAAYLKGREADRVAALQEMTWGLLSSTEFRFNH